jgi:hypothetical protein
MSRRARWIVWIAAGLLFAAALGYLIPDQLQARDQYAQARTALGVTERHTHTVSAELDDIRRDLSILETQVGSDTTALSQDTAQLLGVRTSLAAAQSHVSQQASLISSLHTCLGGVERALNALAVKNQPDAIAALNGVSASCTAAEAASG